jgi:hypothetical protein
MAPATISSTIAFCQSKVIGLLFGIWRFPTFAAERKPWDGFP